MVKLISPRGVKVSVSESRVRALLRQGYKLVEEPAPAAAAPRRTRKKATPKEA
jgi:hypothetical protein